MKEKNSCYICYQGTWNCFLVKGNDYKMTKQVEASIFFWIWTIGFGGSRDLLCSVDRERNKRKQNTEGFLYSHDSVIMMHEKMTCLSIQWCIGSLGVSFSAYPHHQSTFISQIEQR